MALEFGILGPLRVLDGERALDVGGRKPRLLLAVLPLHLGEVVSTDRLLDALWGDDPPPGAAVTLRTHVSHLRGRLAADGQGGSLTASDPGYVLRLAPERLDACRFDELVGRGLAARGDDDLEQAAGTLRDALALWRGPVLADLDRPGFAEAEAARLDNRRLLALEGRVEADLALGRHRELVAELEGLVAAHPFRESFAGHLMTALYRCGRQADALEVYRQAHGRLAGELGLEPGPQLQELQAAILRHDPSVASVPHRVRAAEGPGRPARVPPPLLDVAQGTPMAGRGAQWERLRRAWAEVAAGRREVVVVAGEAGVGKTRLAAELARTVSGEGAQVLVGHCGDEPLIPYHPLVAALRRAPEAVATAARAPAWARDHLGRLAGGHGGARDTDADGDGGGEGRRLEFFEAVSWLLGALAAAAPVLVVIEDLHLADRATTLLLRHVARSLPGRAMVLGLVRDPPATSHPHLLELTADLERHQVLRRLALGPLDAGGLHALVAGATGADPPQRFTRSLLLHTAGNPFFASEVPRHVTEGGALDPAAGRWPDPEQTGRLGVPAGVRDVLRSRLARLPDAARGAVTALAVVGREADFALLAAVSEQPEESLVEALEQAVDAGLLAHTGHAWTAAYAFRHPLIREAVYAETRLAPRQRLHLRAAQAIQASGAGTPEMLGVSAVHLRAAGRLADTKTTVAVSLRAADAASRLYGWDEAAAHAEAALDLLTRDGDAPRQQADVAVRAARLRWHASVDYSKAVEHLERALVLYGWLGDDAAVGRVHGRLGMALATHPNVMDVPRAVEHLEAAERLLGDVGGEPAWHLANARAVAAVYGLDTDRIGREAARAMAVADGLGRPDLRAWAAYQDIWHRFNRGDLAAACTGHEELWTLARQRADAHLGWLVTLGRSLFSGLYLEDPATAVAWCRRALELPGLGGLPRQRQDLQDKLAVAQGLAGDLPAARAAARELGADTVLQRFVALWDGRWEDAADQWERAMDRDLAAGDLLDGVLSAYWLGRMRRLQGNPRAAERALARCLAVSTEGPQVPAELMARAELAQLLAGAERVEEATAHLARCDEILGGDPAEWRGLAGTVELARGAVAAARQQPAEATAAFTAALEVFDHVGLPWRRAETLQARARLATDPAHSDATSAEAEAEQIYAKLGAGDRWSGRRTQA